jgi:CHASE2 domain-containing sensor protein
MVTQLSQWPHWVQILVLVPHGFLGYFLFWFWWPKSDRSWRKFGFVALYLFVFLLVMRYVFGLK